MASSRSKEQKRLKRAQKVQAGRKEDEALQRKKASYVSVATRALRGTSSPALDQFAANLQGQGHEFWVFHAMNFFSSPLDQGMWIPLFPEIYEGVLPRRDTMHKRVMNRHMDPATNTLSDAGVQCVLWMAMRAREMFPLVWKVRAQVRRHGGDPHKPRDVHTWTVLAALGAIMRQSCAGWDDLKAHTWDLQTMLQDMVAQTAQASKAIFSEGAGEADTGESRADSPGT